MKVSPSILTCDFAHLDREMAFVQNTGADLVHLDVMDGVFVPNLSFGPPVIARLRPLTALPFDQWKLEISLQTLARRNKTINTTLTVIFSAAIVTRTNS